MYDPDRLNARRTRTAAEQVVRSDLPFVIGATLIMITLQLLARTADQRLLIATLGVLALAGPGLGLRGLGELRQDNRLKATGFFLGVSACLVTATDAIIDGLWLLH